MITTLESVIHCEKGDADLAAYPTDSGVVIDVIAAGIDLSLHLSEDQANSLILKLSNAVTARAQLTDPTPPAVERVCWWSGGRERGHWVITPVQSTEEARDVVARIEAQGRVARVGDLPAGPPSEEDWARIEKVLRAPVLADPKFARYYISADPAGQVGVYENGVGALQPIDIVHRLLDAEKAQVSR